MERKKPLKAININKYINGKVLDQLKLPGFYNEKILPITITSKTYSNMKDLIKKYNIKLWIIINNDGYVDMVGDPGSPHNPNGYGIAILSYLF